MVVHPVCIRSVAVRFCLGPQIILSIMFLPTHLAAGLIIGKLTGDYPAAVTASLAMDLDHLFAYYRAGILFKFKSILKAVEGYDIGLPQRNFFHNIFFFIIVSALAFVIDFKTGLVLSLAYFCHLAMDSMDNSNYYPFYPDKKINLHGPVKYFSAQDMILSVVLFIIFLLI